MHVLPILLVGFVLGIRHATDADHVVAVAALVSRERRASAASKLGAMWGAGHMLTVMLVGGAIILFGVALPAHLALSLELCVGVMLIALGVFNLASRRVREGVAPRTGRQSFGVGVVHGLAGSAAIALMMLATIRDPRWAVAYLALFGVGTIAGMTAITSAMALPLVLASRAERVRAALPRLAGALSLGFGFFVVYRIAVAW